MSEFFVSIAARSTVPAGRLHVTRTGTGPPMILLHGFPLSSRMWHNQLEALDSDFDLIAPDLRGFGKSSRLVSDWTVGDFAKDIDAMLGELNIESAVICGLSLGGYIAFEFFSHFPQRVSGLVLCNTRADADGESTARGRRLMAERVAREGTWFVHGGMVPKLLASENRTRQLTPDVESFFDGLTPESIAITQLAMASRQDFSSLLNQIDVPTKVIAGEGDIITRASEMKAMADEIPCSEFFVIPNAGHLTPIENPKEFNRVLRLLPLRGQ